MNSKIIILECKREENLKYNDDINLADKIYEMFQEDSSLENVEIFLLNDDYIDYIKSKNINDNPVSRNEYVAFNPYKDYDQAFINSNHSEIVDSAILPVAIFNEKMNNESFEIRITDDQRKWLNACLTTSINNNVTANSVLGDTTIKRIFINDYILDFREDVFDEEVYLIEEILDGADYGITRRFKHLQFVSNTIFSVGFIYVIALSKMPRVVTRKVADTFITTNSGIVNYELDSERIEEIFSKCEKEIYPFCKYLVYPEDAPEIVEAWADTITDEAIEQCAAYDAMNDLNNRHSKKGKKN